MENNSNRESSGSELPAAEASKQPATEAAKRRNSMNMQEKIQEEIRRSTPKRRTIKLKKEGLPSPKLTLTIKQVLAWADAWHERSGKWPNASSGTIPEAPTESWAKIDNALHRCQRGLPGPSSLAKLLAAERGIRNRADLPPLSIAEILAWADAWHERTGKWPTEDSGSVCEGSEQTWNGVSRALRAGRRGLAGGSSLARLLTEERGARNVQSLPPLALSDILKWAKNHKARMGLWPNRESGRILDAPDENWNSICVALVQGHRGLPGGSSLAILLRKPEQRGSDPNKPYISEEVILEWADAHYQNTGKWPTRISGPVAAMPGEIWKRLDDALWFGYRGLTKGSSLARLLEQRRGVRNMQNLPPLTQEQILEWANAWYVRYGKLPIVSSEQVPGQLDLTWRTIDSALRHGHRGLPGGSSLAKLLSHIKQVKNGQAAIPNQHEETGSSHGATNGESSSGR